MIEIEKIKNTSEIEYSMNYSLNSWWTYTIRIFNKNNWEHLREFFIPRISSIELQKYFDYFNEVQNNKIDMKLLSFSKWKAINDSNEEWLFLDESEDNNFDWDSISQIDYIFSEWKEIIEMLEFEIKNYENKFREHRNEIEKLVRIWTLQQISLDSILSDIYWTTTMEWQEEDERIIRMMIQTNIYKDKLLLEEAKKIKDWFFYIKENWLKELSINEAKKIHSICTKWLDEIKDSSQLDYNSWMIRNHQVDLWIFKNNRSLTWWLPPYTPPEKEFIEDKLEKLFDYMNNWDFNLWKLALFHLVFYWIHPFSNWNKRTTRVLESWLIQKYFDFWHLCQWMWFYFRNDISNYYNYLSKTLSWELPVSQWINYYMKSFERMWRMSKEQSEILIMWYITDILSDERCKYYDKIDEVFYRFYKRKMDTWFKKDELREYIKYEWLLSDNLSQWLKRRIEKHLKDWLIIEVKEWEFKIWNIVKRTSF